MALISCPHCNKQNSSKQDFCSHCKAPLILDEAELERLLRKNRREQKNKIYRWKMLSFLAMAIAMIGAVPMVWDYAKSVDYGFQASLINHWGAAWVFAGFILYVVTRIMIILIKKSKK